MFTTLKFRMENSVGTPVCVSLFNNEGLIDYEILFPKLGVNDVRRRSLGRSGSIKLMKRLGRSSFVMFMTRFALSGAHEEEGDFWSLDIELDDGSDIHINGPEPEKSLLYPFIQDFAEFLDREFSITQYISPNRVDKLEIEFLFNEIDPKCRDLLPEYDQCDHTETLTLDRSNFTLSYSKRFPTGCFHSTYECKCEQQVRQILDQTSTALRDGRVFEDVLEQSARHPLLQFSYTFHDGSTAVVHRSLCLEGLRDQLYIEMIDVVFETCLHLLFKGGLFDKRFQFPADEKEKTPFFIVYSEDDESSYVEEVAIS